MINGLTDRYCTPAGAGPALAYCAGLELRMSDAAILNDPDVHPRLAPPATAALARTRGRAA